MKQKNIGKYLGIVFIISVSLGVLIHFEKFANIFNLNERIPDFGYKPHNILETFSDIFVSSMVAFFSFIINYFVIKPFESQQKTDFKRIAFAVIITIATIIILSDLLFSLKKNLTANGNPQNFMFLYFFRDILISAIVIVSVFFIKAINDRQAIKIENEKLKNENLISQYETLKKQVSPHFFLFAYLVKRINKSESGES